MGTLELDKLTARDETEVCANWMEQRMSKQIEVFRNKNVPYGNSAIRGMRRYGIKSGIWRLFDKFNRLEMLVCGEVENTVPDESVEDTLVDLANYALIMAYEIHNKGASQK